jgi:hypothetical protein
VLHTCSVSRLGKHAMDKRPNGPFAPLKNEGLTSERELVSVPDTAQVCTPVPDYAGDPARAVTRLNGRSPSDVWRYKDHGGRLLFRRSMEQARRPEIYSARDGPSMVPLDNVNGELGAASSAR